METKNERYEARTKLEEVGVMTGANDPLVLLPPVLKRLLLS